MKPLAKLILLFLFVSLPIFGQDTEPEKDLAGEFKMTFPSIYFKHNSEEYAKMPYTVDSCLKYIAENIKDLNSYPIWRDSIEKEQLTHMRMKKLRSDLSKYTHSGKVNFQSMGPAQKISRQTIKKSINDQQAQYLLSLNSVLDVSGAIYNKVNLKGKKQKKRLPRLVWCGWRYGFHWDGQGKPNK